MFICHPDSVSGDTAVKICPYFIRLLVLLPLRCEISIFCYKLFIRYGLYEYFLLVSALVFYFHNTVFQRAKVFNFYKVDLINWIMFWVLVSKNSLLNPRSPRFFPMFSSQFYGCTRHCQCRCQCHYHGGCYTRVLLFQH